jgi:hypothetical protein
MEKDKVLSLCRCMILCSLAPVIANRISKDGAIMIECTAWNWLITPLQSLKIWADYIRMLRSPYPTDPLENFHYFDIQELLPKYGLEAEQDEQNHSSERQKYILRFSLMVADRVKRENSEVWLKHTFSLCLLSLSQKL